jgi:site-specific DNA recombinase
MLVNKKYTGDFVWGKYAAGYYHGTEKGEIVPRQKTDKKHPTSPIEHPDRFQAIIERKVFRAVQRRLEKQRGDTSPLRQPGKRFLLSGLLKCGHCGYAMIGYHWHRKKAGERRKMYTCSSHHFQGKKVCTRNTISEAALVECVVRIIQENYLSEASLNSITAGPGCQEPFCQHYGVAGVLAFMACQPCRHWSRRIATPSPLRGYRAPGQETTVWPGRGLP